MPPPKGLLITLAGACLESSAMAEFDDLGELIQRKIREKEAGESALRKPHWLRHRNKYLCGLALALAGLYTNQFVVETVFGRKGAYEASQVIPLWSFRQYNGTGIVSLTHGDSKNSAFYKDGSFHKIPEQENSAPKRIPLPTDFVGEMAEEEAVKDYDTGRK